MIYGPLLSNGFEGFQSTVSYIYDENWRPECFEQKVWHAKGPKAEELDMFGELSLAGLEVGVGEGWRGLAKYEAGGEGRCQDMKSFVKELKKCRPYPSSKGRLPRNAISRGATRSEAPPGSSERPLRWQTVPVTSTTVLFLLMEPNLVQLSVTSCFGAGQAHPSGENSGVRQCHPLCWFLAYTRERYTILSN